MPVRSGAALLLAGRVLRQRLHQQRGVPVRARVGAVGLRSRLVLRARLQRAATRLPPSQEKGESGLS